MLTYACQRPASAAPPVMAAAGQLPHANGPRANLPVGVAEELVALLADGAMTRALLHSLVSY